MTYAQGRPVSMGLFDLHNTGQSDVTITGITLGTSHGLRMTKAWLTPIGHQNGNEELIGVGFPYPPSFSRVARSQWAQRRPLIGEVIRPRQDLNLVFGLIRTGARRGYSAGPQVTYTAGGSTYTLTEQTSLVVTAKC